MKIERIRLHVVRQELGRQRFCYSQAWYGARTMLLLEMTTDTGVTGWGEAFGNPHVNLAILEHVYLPMVLGRDPLDRAVLWRQSTTRCATTARRERRWRPSAPWTSPCGTLRARRWACRSIS